MEIQNAPWQFLRYLFDSECLRVSSSCTPDGVMLLSVGRRCTSTRVGGGYRRRRRVPLLRVGLRWRGVALITRWRVALGLVTGGLKPLRRIIPLGRIALRRIALRLIARGLESHLRLITLRRVAWRGTCRGIRTLRAGLRRGIEAEP
jgi:hypothetical protein